MDSHDIVLLVSVLIGSGGIIGAIVAFYKLKPETGQILVTTAQGVVIMQTGVIEGLHKELIELHATMKQLKTDCDAEIEELRERVRELESGLYSRGLKKLGDLNLSAKES